MKKRKIAQGLARFYLRYGRGCSLVGFFVSAGRDIFYYVVILDVAHRYLDFSPPTWLIVVAMPVLAIGAIVVYYLIGLVDERIGFWKIQNDYANKELTPFFEENFQRLNDKIDKLR